MSNIETKGLNIFYDKSNSCLKISWGDYTNVSTYALIVSKLINNEYKGVINTRLSSTETSYVLNDFNEGIEYKITVYGFSSDDNKIITEDKARIKIDASNVSKSSTQKLFKRVGNKIYFGNYPQTSDGRVLPIEWDIINEKNGKAEILSHYILDASTFSNDSQEYEDSDIRKWLNNEFYNKAFNTEEKAIIQISSLTNKNRVTKDKIFLLSHSAVKDCLPTDAKRQAKVTDYAKSRKHQDKRMLYPAYSFTDTDVGPWWLRSAYDLDVAHAAIKADGKYDFNYHNYDTFSGIRPACWIDLSSTKTNTVPTKKPYKREGKQVIFGSYPQTSDGRSLPIIWDVIGENKDSLSLVSHYILDTKFNDENKYEESDIRKWLNNEFYNRAFNSEEKGIILNSKIKNKVKDTYDKVYILSIKAVTKLFSSAQERKAIATDYAKAREYHYPSMLYPNAHIKVIQGYSPWWVRVSTNDYMFNFTTVEVDGRVESLGEHFVGIRPVIEIKL